MADRLEDAIVLLGRAHIRAALMRDRRTADLIDEARELVQAAAAERTLEGFLLDIDPPDGKTLVERIDEIAGLDGDFDADRKGWA